MTASRTAPSFDIYTSPSDKKQDRTERALTDVEVAALLGVHRTTVWRLMRVRADFPRPYRVGQRAIRWLESEVLAYIERCRA